MTMNEIQTKSLKLSLVLKDRFSVALFNPFLTHRSGSRFLPGVSRVSFKIIPSSGLSK